jgi:hypothetical protein
MTLTYLNAEKLAAIGCKLKSIEIETMLLCYYVLIVGITYELSYIAL